MAATVRLSGNRLTYNVSGGPGTPRDFVGVYRPGAANAQYLTWKYLANDGTVRPSVGETSGTVNLTMPLQISGRYEIRFISVNTNSGAMKLEATYGPFSFDPISETPPSPPPAPPPAPPPSPPPAPPPAPPPGPSLDGTTITGGTGQLVNVDGTWTFGPPISGHPDAWQILRNGAWNAGGMSGLLEIAQGGMLYHVGLDGQWYVWRFGQYQSANNPNSSPPAPPPSPPPAPPPSPPPAPPPPPPPGLSPDGSVITSGTGTLVTVAGTWTFGTPVSPPGNWNLLLNGASAAGGLGSKLEVANGGKMYAFGTDNSWYIWQGSSWAKTGDPTLPPPPPAPPGEAVPKAITLFPSTVSLPDNSPAGTHVCSVSVTMSDGSSFAGTLTTSDTTFFAISGSNVVTARDLTSNDDGPHSTTITATQGPQSLTAKVNV